MISSALFLMPFGALFAFLWAGRRRTRLVASRLHPRLVRADTMTVRARALGLLLAVAAVVVAWPMGRWGQGVFVVPAVAALAMLVGLIGGEVVTWRSARTRGIATLEHRRPAGYLPVGSLAALGLSLAALALLLAWCRAHQNPTGGDFGAPGRAWIRDVATGSEGGSPFPGTFYSLPLMWLLISLVAVLGVGLALVATRPHNGADPVVVAVDDDARRRSAATMTAAAIVGVAGELLFSLVASSQAAGEYVVHGSALALVLAIGATVLGARAAAIFLEPGGPQEVGA